MEQMMKQLGVLEEALRNLANTATRLEDRAVEERREIYDRMDAIRDKVEKLTAALEVHDERLSNMEPIVNAMEDKNQQTVGAKHFGKLMWTAIISVITVVVSVGSQVLQYLHTSHSH